MPELSNYIQIIFNLLTSNANLKVKINAALALCVPAEREYFEGTVTLVDMIDQTLQESVKCDKISVFGQLKYKETLKKQAIWAKYARFRFHILIIFFFNYHFL